MLQHWAGLLVNQFSASVLICVGLCSCLCAHLWVMIHFKYRNSHFPRKYSIARFLYVSSADVRKCKLWSKKSLLIRNNVKGWKKTFFEGEYLLAKVWGPKFVDLAGYII